ncbi:hypothetical protein D3C73_1458120 [compost metagenome]
MYAFRIPSLPIIVPPVGKSGPFTISINSSSVISGLSICVHIPFITSVKLCGGILHAIPTAIPYDPFINKFGSLAGNTEGSFNLSS